MLTVAEWFSLHFQAISAMSSPAMGSSPPIVIVAIDIDIELISCLLSEISLEKLSGIHGGLPNSPHVKVSLLSRDQFVQLSSAYCLRLLLAN